MASKKEFACRCHQSSMSHKHNIPTIAQEFRTDLLATGWHLDTFWALTNLNPVHAAGIFYCVRVFQKWLLFYGRVDAILFAPPSKDCARASAIKSLLLTRKHNSTNILCSWLRTGMQGFILEMFSCSEQYSFLRVQNNAWTPFCWMLTNFYGIVAIGCHKAGWDERRRGGQ